MTTPRLAVLHTAAALVDPFRAKIAARYGDLDCFHVVDESLLQDLMRGGASDAITARVVDQARLAERAGATAILCTCSSVSPAVDAARQGVGIPIVKIDDAMAEQAVQAGHRIGVLCTANSTLSPSRDILLAEAERTDRTVEVEAVHVDGAFAARGAGDQDRHDVLVKDAARTLANDCDVIVLAQASRAHLQPDLADELGIPVLASPDLCIADLGNRLGLSQS